MNIEVTCATPDRELYANVRANSRACSKWLTISPAHGGHAVIVGGGPSVADKLPLIRKRIALGQKVFALNGACRFLNDHGIVPDYQVFLDANPELTDRIGEAKEYLVASQCNPNLIAALPSATLWHPAIPNIADHWPANWEDGATLIGGGVTVGLTTMCLAYTMGYRFLHLFGYDSSNRNGADHAYAAPIAEERLGDMTVNFVSVTYGDKVFESTIAMAYQAEVFPTICNNLIDAGCTITVDCDGLIMAVMDEIKNSIAALAA